MEVRKESNRWMGKEGSGSEVHESFSISWVLSWGLCVTLSGGDGILLWGGEWHQEKIFVSGHLQKLASGIMLLLSLSSYRWHNFRLLRRSRRRRYFEGGERKQRKEEKSKGDCSGIWWIKRMHREPCWGMIVVGETTVRAQRVMDI